MRTTKTALEMAMELKMMIVILRMMTMMGMISLPPQSRLCNQNGINLLRLRMGRVSKEMRIHEVRWMVH